MISLMMSVCGLLSKIDDPVELSLSTSHPPYTGNVIPGPLIDSEAGCDNTVVCVVTIAAGYDTPFLGMSTSERREQVEVVVRGEPQDFVGSQSLASACRDAVHQATASGWVDIRAMNPAPVYVGSDDAGRHIWRLAVEGWREAPLKLTTHTSSMAILGLHGTSDEDIWAVGQQFVSHWNGSAWTTTVVSEDIWRAYAVSDELAYFCGTDGAIYKWNGTTIAAMADPSSGESLFSVWASSATNVWVADGTGKVWVWSGSAWAAKSLTLGAGDYVLFISGTSASDVWLGTNEGALYHYDGTTFTAQSLDTSAGSIHCLLAISQDEVWYGTVNGEVGEYDGTEWVAHEVGDSGDYVLCVHGSSSADLWAVDSGGTVYRYDGAAWKSAGLVTSSFFAAVFSPSPDSVWIADYTLEKVYH